MRNVRGMWVAVLLVLALVAAACGSDEGDDGAQPTEATEATTAATTEATEATTTATTEATTTTEAEMIELVIWADENRAEVMEQVAPAFEEATGVDVIIEIVDFGEIRNQVQTAGPAGEGPDIFIGAGDWSGELATNGVVAAIDLGSRASEFNQIALDMFSFDGTVYALPYATEAIAMYYNADLVETPPTTWEELTAICDGLTDITNCVGIPGGGDGGDAYHNYPFLTAAGGNIFGYDPASGWDGSMVLLDSEESVAGIEVLEAQVDAGYIGSTNYDTAKNQFLEGTQPFWITGPWELGNLGDTDLNWAVVTIPTIGGSAPAPFVGGQGFYLSAFSENTVIAQSFLFDFVATQDTMQALFDADPRTPAHLPTLEANSDDAAQVVFADSAATGFPLPNIPEMGSVWGPLGDNILAVRNGEISAAEAMANAQTSVEEALAG